MEKVNEKKGTSVYVLLLILTTVLWGISFVVTEQLLKNNVPVFMLLSIQFAIGAVCLLLFAFWGKHTERKPFTRAEAINGIILGILLGASFVLKYFGLDSYSQGTNKSYFFSSVYVLFVPVLICIFEKKFALKNIIDGLIALVGLAFFYNIFSTKNFFFSLFDGLSLLGGIIFAFYYYFLGKYAGRFENSRWVFFQLLSVAIICSIFTLVFEMKYMSQIKNSGEVAIGLIYLGVFCTGFAYIVLVMALKKLHTSAVSIIVSSDSIFAFLFALSTGYAWFAGKTTIIGTIILVVAVLSSLIVGPQKFYSAFGRVFSPKKQSTDDSQNENDDNEFEFVDEE